MPVTSQTPRTVAQPARRARRRFTPAFAVPVSLAALLTACDHAARSTPPPAVAPDGWTQLAPSFDSRLVHVSSSSGDDANDGLSEQSPKATLEAARTLLRTENPDWLLIKRGDKFTAGLGEWSHSGRSAAEPMVVTTFGPSSERPIFDCDTTDGLTVHENPVHDVAFVGLHFALGTEDGRNGSYGVSLLAPCTRVLIEDCKIERFFTNLRFQGSQLSDLRLRRSVVTDAFAKEGNAQGIYVSALRGCLIEECVFDHNGWRSEGPHTPATLLRHNIYIQGDARDVVIRGNIIARGGSHGLQARSGGDVHQNLFLGNPINMLVGSNILNEGAVTASVIGNVVLDGRDISPLAPRGWAAHFQCLASGEIAYNVAAHQVTGTAPRSYEFDSILGVGINYADFHHNVSYRWGAPINLTGNRFTGFVLRSNDLQEFGNSALIRTNGAVVDGILSGSNRFNTAAPSNSWVYFNGQYMSLAWWMTHVADGTSIATQVAYPRADETIADYDLGAGGSGSLESFLARARKQSRTNWSDRHVGTNAAAYFRSNFNVGIP